MKRVPAHELTEDAIPAMVLQTSEQRLREMFPVPFSAMDSLSEPEPSRGALLQLGDGSIVVVAYGKVSHRTTVSVPVSADIRRTIRALVREAGITRDDILWLSDAQALRNTSTGSIRERMHRGTEARTIKPLRERSEAELRAREDHLRKQLLNLRFQSASGRTHHAMKVRKVKRELAQIESLLNNRANAKDRA